jgi:hypothetical protein
MSPPRSEASPRTTVVIPGMNADSSWVPPRITNSIESVPACLYAAKPAVAACGSGSDRFGVGVIP